MEIERKYLLNTLPFDLSSFEKHDIAQGYISIDPVIRLRKMDNNFVLTLKGSGDMQREEIEMPLTDIQFEKLWRKVEGGVVEKTRYIIPLNQSLTAELDIYKNCLHGLMTVEVEFGTVKDAENFSPPVWFGEDVTFDRRYKNSNLAMFGLTVSR